MAFEIFLHLQIKFEILCYPQSLCHYYPLPLPLFPEGIYSEIIHSSNGG